VLPLEDCDNVDQRRHSVGLGSLSEYVATWQIKMGRRAIQKGFAGD